MQPSSASERVPEKPEAVLSAYRAHVAGKGRGNATFEWGARAFLARWPDVQTWADEPLAIRLEAGSATRPFITFLMVTRRLRPGYDYLVARKLSSFWRDLVGSAIEYDLRRFMDAATELGFSDRMVSALASQAVARLLIQTGRPLEGLTAADLEEMRLACVLREQRTGDGWWHYRMALRTTERILFHMGVLATPPPAAGGPLAWASRLAGVREGLAASLIAYLQRKTATCRRETVTGLATRLSHFGRILCDLDPDLDSFAGLDRRRHIEPYLTALTNTASSKTGLKISIADRARRIHAVSVFLTEITEWGWAEAPGRRLLFSSDLPRQPRPLPRYLPLDADRRLREVLAASPNRLVADALLLARACGLRIGELLDLELDCVHEVPGQGFWLKVPLGKLDTERMVPLDEETVALVDRIAATRSPGRPLVHPRRGQPADFLFTHHGRRLTHNALRRELSRAGRAVGLEHITPHSLRHTYATALVNAGVSLQALMALLGHVSAAMSLRYARLFDSTVRTEYERALELAKSRIDFGLAPVGRQLPVVQRGDWRQAPAIKARRAGGFCLRAPAQGACPYANICEHCPNFRTDASHLSVLAAQRVDAEALAADAETRGWIPEAERHRRLLTRLDALIAEAQGA